LSSSTSASGSSNRARLIGGASLLAVGLAGVTLATKKPIEASTPTPDYKAIRALIAKFVEDEPSNGPLFIRLAWHTSGTYSKETKTGGSNGSTMRFKPESNFGANAGLHLARNLLESVKKAHPEITYADLWTLAGVVAIEELGGPVVGWRAGRSDKDDGSHCPPDGRLPDADKGHPNITAQHVRDVFYRMGFNDREIVALLGAHAVGRGHTDRSGYSGPWTHGEFSFTNDFYRELLEQKWTKKKWNGPEQYENEKGNLMMLPADLVLLQDPIFRKYTELYAKDQDLFFRDFAKAFQKLEELGVPFKRGWFDWLWGK